MAERKVSQLQKLTLDAVVEEYNQTVTALGVTGVILHHESSVSGDLESTADGTDLTTNVTLANSIKTNYGTHIASTKKHSTADSTNTVSAADATDQSTLNTLINELKADLNAHQSHSGHRGSGGQGGPVAAPQAIATADATDLATSTTLVNAIKAAYNLHVQSGAQTLDRGGT